MTRKRFRDIIDTLQEQNWTIYEANMQAKARILKPPRHRRDMVENPTTNMI